MARNVAVSRLMLTDFRCFAAVTVETDARPVVLTGPNGAGKTSLLEALSLLSPGAGLRGARLGDLTRRGAEPVSGEYVGWAIAARVEGLNGPADVGTGLVQGAGEPRRVVRIDGRPVRGPAALADTVSALWLTPAMDRLFADGASGRRRFMDRLVFGFDPEHARRTAAYERTMRERSRLLRRGPADAVWLTSLEGAMAASGIAVAAARRATLRRLDAALAEGAGPFPGAGLHLEGAVENWLEVMPAVDAEARLAEALAGSRGQDAETGGAAHGPHRSDLAVRHLARDMPAAQCSTGEQKTLLIAIVLAAVRAQAVQRGAAPLLLLDEVAAHLDAAHREALFEAIVATGAQTWLTGTDAGAFAALGSKAAFFTVGGGMVTGTGLPGGPS